jgi:hypothetical protein
MSDEKKPTREDIKRRMEEAGFTADTWGQTNPSGDKVDLSHLTHFKNQADLLKKLLPLLEAQAAHNQSQVDDLREKVERLKHGGGV